MMAIFCKIKVHKETSEYPFVSVIISAFNEDKHIESKILNTLAQDYPKDKMEILIGSDGSVDKTVEVAKKYSHLGVVVLDFPKNQGKTRVQNECVNISRGEILIFTDAASFLGKEAVMNLVRNFSDQRIGCVAGRMRFVNTDNNMTTGSQGLYWRYEVKIRELESRIGRLIGVDGPLYAIRRENFIFLESNIISDLISPLLVLAQGKNVVLEEHALVDEEPTTKSGQELNTRRRITLRALVGLKAHSRLLNPLIYPGLSLQLFFHKVLRWFVGPLVLVNILSSILLSGKKLFFIISIGYGIFFLAALLGFLLDHYGKKVKILFIPYYFTLVNLSATMAIIDFLRKKQSVSWQPVRVP
jgi:cellulose synthase/poly-beta-1,6-N-acetylglucosamine synthase-like glycosyltransferase